MRPKDDEYQAMNILRHSLLAVLATAAILFAAACDTGTAFTDSTQNPSKPPATSPSSADASPVTASPVELLIDGKRVTFPSARVVLQKRQGRIAAVVYSDDPRDAIKPEYTGNSFYLLMQLDISDDLDIDGAVWAFKSSTSSFEESPYGIFLEGNRKQLQPSDVAVQFVGPPERLEIELRGTFMLFDLEKDEKLGVLTPVTGKFNASVDKRTKSPSGR